MRERILVIEDEDKILQFLQRGLTYEGYRVEMAADGAAGLALARAEAPDLVILDWMLPGMDGLEVCRRLRAGGPAPILMLTGRDSVSDRWGGARTPPCSTNSISTRGSPGGGRGCAAGGRRQPICWRSPTCASTPEPIR